MQLLWGVMQRQMQATMRCPAAADTRSGRCACWQLAGASKRSASTGPQQPHSPPPCEVPRRDQSPTVHPQAVHIQSYSQHFGPTERDAQWQLVLKVTGTAPEF